MNKKITFVVLFFLSFLNVQADNFTSLLYTSTYTSINQKDCVTLDSDNMGSIQECESFVDIGVKVIEGDIRQSIVLTRHGEEYDLAFWSTVGSAFSSLGLKIEWRHELQQPKNVIGMIVRFEANDDYENIGKSSSYLLVSKITNEEMCVVAKVAPQERQNEMARKILDSKDELPCLRSIKKSEK
ncbi:MAG: Unknown protein [uncultured Sulfurovum sp.]|uniref:Uncharacterized protein n=1 Tax=uncultured Sulfurovum sp. TaxID=269237 RepID=A0A6S6SD15_9BACT|nr:MAG: Unknown protein [uncultured Sulfurovum sp.]